MKTYFIRILVLVGSPLMFLFFHLKKNNDLTEFRMKIPLLEKSLKKVSEENERLKFEIEKSKNPTSLLEISKSLEFGHLHYAPLESEIILPEIKQ